MTEAELVQVLQNIQQVAEESEGVLSLSVTVLGMASESKVISSSSVAIEDVGLVPHLLSANLQQGIILLAEKHNMPIDMAAAALKSLVDRALGSMMQAQNARPVAMMMGQPAEG